MYSKKVVEYFENPINFGVIENADGIGIVENEVCSDIIKIYIKIKEILSVCAEIYVILQDSIRNTARIIS